MKKWVCSICGHVYEGNTPAAFCVECGADSYDLREQKSKKQVTLLDCGEEQEKVIRIIRKITAWDLDEIMELVDNCPGQLSADDAQIEELLSAGAKLTYTQEKDICAASESAASRKAQSTVINTGYAWNTWKNLPTGHEQAMTAMFALRNITDEFRNELLDARKEWENAKIRSQNTYDSETSNARKKFENEQQRFQSERDTNVNATGKRKDKVYAIVKACTSFINNVTGDVRSAANNEMNSVRNREKEVMAAIDAKIQAYRDLCNCLIAESQKARDDELDRARIAQIDRDAQEERNYQAKNTKICKDRCTDIRKMFNQASVYAYQQEILSTRFNAANYKCPSEVPDYVMLGDIGLIIPNKDQDDLSVVQAVELQTADIGSKQAGEYIVKIPYAQRLSDGISLLIRYSPNDRNYAQGLIQTLLLKLFMSFPAGKLEATMIDPLELGASFLDIPKLAKGPNSAHIIDTKIWTSEKDIEKAIATLRQRLENMTQAYGGDQMSRLKKEAVRALSITDFPVNFNDTALKDLHAIVRNSASLGVCVLICANDEELKKLRRRNGNLVAEISESMVETKTFGKRLMLIGKNREGIFLQPDEMQDALRYKEKILSIISDGIEHMPMKVEHFDSMYSEDIYDCNNWFTGNHEEIAIPIGIKGADTVVRMVLGRRGTHKEHHVLISGQIGVGKSTLLHTIIMSTLINYLPDEVQMYLLDFKEGVEFSVYTRYRLPSLQVVAINSEREFGLNILKELCGELETRAEKFKPYGISEINDYAKLSDAPKVPKILLIFDEVQELFSNMYSDNSISRQCTECLYKLVTQGRAMGIHVILASQDFHSCTGLKESFKQMAVRIAIKGSEECAASILASDNAGIRALQNQPEGAAIYNGGNGVESANSFFQISYIDEKERLRLLECLDAYYTDPVVAPLYEEWQTRVLLTNIEDNINNCFNKLILKGFDRIEPLGSTEGGYGLLLGQGFGKKSNFFIPELGTKDRDNLLIVTRDEKMALSLFILSAMSVLYEELHTNADKKNALVYIVDLFADELADEKCDFDFLESQFPQQVRVAKVGDMQELIVTLYETVKERMEGRSPFGDRIFLMFFGINRALCLRNGKVYEEDYKSEISLIEILQKIFMNGPEYGVNNIVWGENIQGIESLLGEQYEDMFDKRMAYRLDEESINKLVAESEAKALRGKTTVYMDARRDAKNTHFRPYEVPAKAWVERYAEAYHEIINEGDY